MKKYSVASIILSLICIGATVFQNFRLLRMYRQARGKDKALFGITEISELDVKLYIGIGIVFGLILALVAIRKKENRTLSYTAVLFALLSSLLLFVRLWTYWV